MRNRLWKSSAVAVVPALVVLWWLPRGAPVEAQAGLADAVRLAAQIDAQIASRWQEVQLAPAPLSNDAEFFRRLYLDVCGVIPPPSRRASSSRVAILRNARRRSTGC